MRITAGQLLNHLARCVTPPTMSPAANELWPAPNLFDGRPGTTARFGSAGPDSYVAADLNVLVNGDFDAPVMTGWVAITGTLFREGTIAKANASAGLEDGPAIMGQDNLCRSGELMKLEWSIYGKLGEIPAASAQVGVLNKDTGRHLHLDGKWRVGFEALDEWPDESWHDGSKIFSVEPVSETLRDLTMLRIEGRSDGVGPVYFDDFFLYPATDLVVALGHNVGKLLTPEFRAGAAGTTLHATLVPRRRSFFALLAGPVLERFVRLKLAGTPFDPVSIGELVFAQTVGLPRAPLFPLQSDSKLRQITNETPGGEQWRLRLASEETREIPMSFRWASEEEHLQLRDCLFRASAGGAHPCILIPERGAANQAPWGDDSGDILYGRIEETLSNSGETRTSDGEGVEHVVRTDEIRFLEAPFPR